MRRGSFDSNRIARAVSHIPVITADADASTVYEQTWRRRDGKAVRKFDVLALDEEMAETLGGVRLKEKYAESILDWTLVGNRPVERVTSKVIAVLTLEDPDEQQIRYETWLERRDGDADSFEARE